MVDFSSDSSSEAFSRGLAATGVSGRSIFSQPEEPARLDQATVDTFTTIANKYGVPADVLLGLAEKDSGFNEFNRSRGPGSKVRGIINVTDEEVARGEYNPYDTAQNVEAAARKLRSYMQAGASVEEAVMAHAGGPDRSKWSPEVASYAQDVLARSARLSETYYPGMAPRVAETETKIDPATGRPTPLTAEEVGRAYNIAMPEASVTEDMARQFEGGAIKGAGSIMEGAAQASNEIRRLSGLPEYRSMANAIADRWMESGKQVERGVSDETKKVIADSSPEGDISKPSTWTLGKNPSLPGYFALGLDVFGGMLPVVAAAVGGGVVGGAIVGGLQGGGAAAQGARETINKMATTPADPNNPDGPKEIEQQSSYYQELIKQGKTPEQALNLTRSAAERYAFLLTTPVSALGGAATGKILSPASKIFGGNAASRIAGKTGLEAAEEGIQETGEQVAQNVGTNVGGGTNIDPMQDTFGNFILGVIGGGGTGGSVGALQEVADRFGRKEPAPEDTTTRDPSAINAAVVAPLRAQESLAASAGEPRDATAMGAAGRAPAAAERVLTETSNATRDPSTMREPVLEASVTAAPEGVAPAASTDAIKKIAAEAPGRQTAADLRDIESAPKPATARPGGQGPLSRVLDAGAPSVAPLATAAGQRVVLSDETGSISGIVVGQDAEGIMFKDDTGFEQLIENDLITSGKVSIAPEDAAPTPAPAAPDPFAMTPDQRQAEEEYYAGQTTAVATPTTENSNLAAQAAATIPTEPTPAPTKPSLSDMSEEELRAKLKYIAGQGKANGWNPLLIKAHKEVERAINGITSRNVEPTPEAPVDAATAQQPEPSPIAVNPSPEPLVDEEPTKPPKRADAAKIAQLLRDFSLRSPKAMQSKLENNGLTDTHEVYEMPDKGDGISRFGIREKAAPQGEISPPAPEAVEIPAAPAPKTEGEISPKAETATKPIQKQKGDTKDGIPIFDVGVPYSPAPWRDVGEGFKIREHYERNNDTLSLVQEIQEPQSGVLSRGVDENGQEKWFSIEGFGSPFDRNNPGNPGNVEKRIRDFIAKRGATKKIDAPSPAPVQEPLTTEPSGNAGELEAAQEPPTAAEAPAPAPATDQIPDTGKKAAKPKRDAKRRAEKKGKTTQSKETTNAAQEGLKPEDNQQQYQDGNGGRKTTEAGRSDSDVGRGQSQEAISKEKVKPEIPAALKEQIDELSDNAKTNLAVMEENKDSFLKSKGLTREDIIGYSPEQQAALNKEYDAWFKKNGRKIVNGIADPVAEHKETGEPSEAASQEVVSKTVRKAANAKKMSPSQMRDYLVGEIDKAIANAPKPDSTIETTKPHMSGGKVVFNGVKGTLGEPNYISVTVRENLRGWGIYATNGGGKYGGKSELIYSFEASGPNAARKAAEALLDRAYIDEAGDTKIGEAKTVTFDVPGDGKFNVVNTVQALTSFRDRVMKSPGFKGKSAKSSAPATNKPANQSEDVAAAPPVEEAPETNEHGPVFRQYYHDAKGAIERLMKEKSGDAVGALYHPDVGDIDLVWGKERNDDSKGYGLAKIAQIHPEVIPDLQKFILRLKRNEDYPSKTRVRLEDKNGVAMILLEWLGETKTWLLTAYEKNASDDATLDTTIVTATDDTARRGTGADQNIATGSETGKTTTIQDAGEKIGGARKDLWKERGLSLDDLKDMSSSEAAELVTKDNVWPRPDYAKMIDGGIDPVAARLIKSIYDRLSKNPRIDNAKGRENYITMMSLIRKYAEKAKTVDDVRRMAPEIRAELGLASGMSLSMTPEQKAAREVNFSVYKNRQDPLVLKYGETTKAKNEVEAGWPTPAKKEAWERSYDIVRSGYGFAVRRKGGMTRMSDFFKTREEAEAFAKEYFEANKNEDGRVLPERPHLDRLERTGKNVRLDRDVDSQDFINDFGFRGIEFGNYVASDERQKVVNLAYDALIDLADIVGIPPKALSLDGTLGLAFGARGKGSAKAHYEPGKLVINMTKLSGAGALAHEWAHGLDHYLGELDTDAAYQGRAKGASGWYEKPRIFAPEDGRRLKNLRPELSKAFDGVMQALFLTKEDQAEAVRQAELRLEQYQARLEERQKQEGVLPTEIDILRTYVKGAKQKLAELRGESPPLRLIASSFAKEAEKLSGKTGDYWKRPTEMFARSFESFVFDKIAEMGNKSEYLVHGVEGDRYDNPSYKGNPYPKGAERVAINDAFQNLVDTLKVREGKNGPDTAVYSVGKTKEPEIRAVGLSKTVSSTASYVNDQPLKSHADYRAAKAGDIEAATRFVADVVKQETIEKAKSFGPDVIFAPVGASEAKGVNMIPAALAELYAAHSGAESNLDIIQTNKAYHTGAPAMERLLARSTFDGPVEAGRNYVIVDDVTVMGSTLADMAAHIQRNGGNVVGVITLANASRVQHMSASKAQIKEIERRFGDVVRETFHVEPSALTGAEATYVLNHRDADALRTRVAAAEAKRGQRLRAQGVSEASPETSGVKSSELTETITSGKDGPIIKAMIDSGRVVIHDTAATAPGFTTQRGPVQAAVTPDGKIHLVAGNLNSSTALGVLLHEAFHAGGETLLGSAGFRALLRRVQTAADNAKPGSWAAEAKARAEAAGTPSAHMAEEIAAYAIEDAENAPAGIREIADRIVGAVKAFVLRKFGKQIGAVTPGQLRSLAIAALRAGAPVGETRTQDGVRFTVGDSAAAFKRWFGSSKVVDAKGNPLVVYHGTADDFSTFDKSKIGSGAGHKSSFAGFFFSADANIAGFFPKEIWGGWPLKREILPGQNIMPVYLSIKNPLVISANEFRNRFVRNFDDAVSWKNQAIKDGYDGILIQADARLSETMGGDEYAADAWIAFRPEQIKSATGNNGSFDPSNPDIRFSIASTAGATKPKGKTAFERATNAASDFLTQAMVGGGARPGQFSSLALAPVRALFTELAKGMPSARGYLDTKQAMDAFRNEMNTADDALLQDWLKWGRKNKTDNSRLMDVMHDSTLAQYDPTLTDKEAAAKGQIVDRAVKEAYDTLPKEAKEFYAKIRDAYSQRSKDVEEQVVANVKKALTMITKNAQRTYDDEMARIKDEGLTGKDKLDAEKAAQQNLTMAQTRLARNKAARIKRMREYFENNRLKGPYFPLARFGNYFVTLRDGDGKVLSFEKYASRSAQRARAEELRGLYGKDAVQESTAQYETKEARNVDPGFLASVDTILDEAGVDMGVRDAIYQTYLQTMPDLSMRKASIHRKGTPGFDKDAVRGYAHNMFHSAHQLSRLRYGMDLQDHLAEAAKQVRDSDDPIRTQAVYNEMVKSHEFTMNPDGSPLAHYVTSAVFLWTMAFNLSTAMVNTMQSVNVGIPNIAFDVDTAGNAGIRKATRAMADAGIDFVRGKGSVLNSGKLSADERAAVTAAYDSGLIDSTQAHDLAGVAESGISYRPGVQRFMRAASLPMHHTERFNREVTFLAAYRVARDAGLDHVAGIKKASDQTWATHFDNQSNAKPRFARGQLGKMLFALKSYQANFVYRIFRDLHQALEGKTEAERKTALKRFASMFALTAAAAGIRGAFFYSTVMAIAGAFMGLAGNDDDDPDEIVRKFVIEHVPDAMIGHAVAGVMLDGIPGYLTGTSLTNRVQDMWSYSNDRDLNADQQWTEWTTQFLGVGAGIVFQLWKGKEEIEKGNIERGVEKMLPAALRNVAKAARYGYEGVQDKNGNPIVDNVPLQDVLKQAIGFTPAEIADRFARNTYQRNRQDRIEAKATDARKAVARAMRAGDAAAEAEGRKAVDKFNAKYPEYQIRPKSIMQSMRNMENRKDRMEFGVDLNKKLSDRIKAGTAPSIYAR